MTHFTAADAERIQLIVSNRRSEFLSAANLLNDRIRSLTAADRLALSALIAAVHVADTAYAALDLACDDGGDVALPALIAEWVALASDEPVSTDGSDDPEYLASRAAYQAERSARLLGLAKRIAG